MDFKQEISKLLENSSYLKKLEQENSRQKMLIEKSRPLQDREIAILESQGNYCQDWALVKVHSQFQTPFVRGNIFSGKIYLGKFEGGLKATECSLNRSIMTGIYNSCINSSIIDSNSAIHGCTAISQYFINEDCLVGGSILSYKTDSTFALGTEVTPGAETGERALPLSPELFTSLLAEILKNRELKKLYCKQVKNFSEKVITSFENLPFIGTGSVILNSRIDSSLIFDHCEVKWAGTILNSSIMSSEEEPTKIGAEVIVEDSIIQEGVRAESGALIESSLIMEHSETGRHCKIKSSVIGTNSSIEEGEITSSFAGPFTAAHHQSMLIASVWPAGRGNMGYGANVGSNHTSRQPDQELFPGEGTFWGLGCSIKFPGNYVKSPYSIVATGVVTEPQRVEFPFSLIKSGSSNYSSKMGISSDLNEIVPAWVLSHNAYSLFRNEWKFKHRNRSKRDSLDFNIMRDDIVRLMMESRNRLLQVGELQEVHTEAEIPGLGKNYITERNRVNAIETYSMYMKYHCLKNLVHRVGNILSRERKAIKLDEDSIFSPEKCDLVHEIYRCEELHNNSLSENLMEYIKIFQKIYSISLKSRSRDFKRGNEIMGDYSIYHTPPEEDSFLQELKKELNITKERVEQFLRAIAEYE